MSRQGLTALVPVVAVSLLVWLPATAQAQTAETGTFTQPPTPWGDPDLRGLWTNATITPLQRPREFIGKEVLTEEEAIALEQVTAEARVDGPPRAGDPGTYNRFWFDQGSKIVGTGRTSLIVDPPDGRIPWTPEASQANANRDPGRGRDYWHSYTDLDTGERCLTDGLPFLPFAYNNNYQILQTPGHVAILHEMFYERRIIPIDGGQHIAGNIGQWFGDSRGRWEGDTLVVETTNFSDKTSYRWAAHWRASRPTLHLIERFTRVDAQTMDYQFTVTDPTMFTSSWTGAVPMRADQAAVGATVGQLYEYACHEGNYAMVNVLSGARAQEQIENGVGTDSR